MSVFKYPYQLKIYKMESGRKPYNEWVNAQDSKIKQKIRSKEGNIRLNNWSNVKPIKGMSGGYELVDDSGPGYRIYFSKRGKAIVLLLCAGIKKTQKNDIEKAKEYLADYIKRGNKNGRNKR